MASLVSAAQRRKQRRLRSRWRHEQQSIAAVLAMEESGTQHYTMEEDESVPELGGRPAPLVEPRPQEEIRRHKGVGFELVLDPVVPQLGQELVDEPTVVSQPEFQQHSVEQNVDIPVRGGVGHRGDLLAGVISDLAHLEEVRGPTAVEVMRWFVDPARDFTLTSEEQYSMVRLMPDYAGRYTASPGRHMNIAPRAGARARAADPGADRGGGGRAVHRDSGG